MSFNWLELQKTAHDEFGTRLAHVTDWEGETPDTEWNTRELVTHVIDEQRWVPLLLSGLSVAEAKAQLEPLGTDLVTEWARFSAGALAAWDAIDLAAPVQLSYDTVPARDYLAEQVSDVAIHSWDVARATSSVETLEDDLVAAVWTIFEPQRDTLELSGLFASPVPIPENAPLLIRLLALTGRDGR